MKKTVTLGVMMLGLFATSVQTETKHCHTIEDCRQQIAERKADLAELLKSMMTGILKTGVSQYQAKTVCDEYEDAEGNKDYRLPTVRELVQDAILREALPLNAISETKKDGDYNLVKGLDSEGNSDHFYFSNRGYKRPAEDLGKKWVWSSSVNPNDDDDAYALYGYDGVIAYGERSDGHSYNAVRCLLSR